MGTLDSYKVKVTFSNLSELEKSLAFLTEYHGPNQSYEIHLVWNSTQLTKDYYLAASKGLERMRRKNGSVLCYLPLCFEDKLGITTFPHCDDCVLAQTGNCQYPSHGKSLYPSPQVNLNSRSLFSFSHEDFYADCPPTWLIPSRTQIQRLAQVFQDHSRVLDFGCGSGFLAGLLLEEGLKVPVVGYDPLVDSSLDHPNFHFHKTLSPPSPEEKWALFSSLGDFRVPLQDAIKYRPQTIGMFLFTPVFGLGGSHFQGEWKAGQYREEKIRDHFSLEDITKDGYHLVEKEMVHSPFFPDQTELRIYSLKPEEIAPRRRESILPFSWENKKESCSPISTLDLS